MIENNEYRELEYKDTIPASTVVPPDLRVLLQRMRESPKSKEEEIWGDLLEDRVNRLSQSRGERDLIEMEEARKEFFREYCRNRGIENTDSYQAELEGLRAKKRLTPARAQRSMHFEKMIRNPAMILAVIGTYSTYMIVKHYNKQREYAANDVIREEKKKLIQEKSDLDVNLLKDEITREAPELLREITDAAAADGATMEAQVEHVRRYLRDRAQAAKATAAKVMKEGGRKMGAMRGIADQNK